MELLLYCQVYEPLYKIDPMQSQKQDKWLSLYLNLTYVSLPCSLASKKPYVNLLKMHFLVPYDSLNGSFVKQCVLP
jgi:hypothetical protein